MSQLPHRKKQLGDKQHPSQDAEQALTTDTVHAPKHYGDLPDFDRSLPMSLLRAREAVMLKFIPYLKEHGLSAPQWRALRTLDQDNGLVISELSQRCYLLKPSMSRIVQNLEARGLIERRDVATDQRRTALFITKDGREMVGLIAPQSEERYQFITHQFGARKLELLQELLEDLVVAINEED